VRAGACRLSRDRAVNLPILALIASASAHVPHDQVTAVAMPAGHPWFAVATPGSASLLLESDDAGDTWRFVGGPPTADTLIDAAALPDGTVVLLGVAHVWWGGADGWAATALPGDVGAVAADGDVVLLAGPDGIWAGTRDGLVRESTDSIATLSAGVAIGEDGVLRERSGGAWTRREGPGSTLRAAARVEETLYVGDADGTVWRADGAGWARCGALGDRGDHPSVRQLAADGDALLVATASRGPWRSLDGCRTWTDRAAPLEASYGTTGGPSSEQEAFTALGSADGRILLAGWDGLATSDDAGAQWHEAPIVPPDYTRGLAFSPAFEHDGLVYWGADSAGVAVTSDGGATFSAPNVDLSAPNVQYLKAWPESDGGRVFVIAGHHLHVSDDRGVSWPSVPTPFSADTGVFPWSEPGHLWVAGTGGAAPVEETLDGGQTWSPVTEVADVHGLLRVTPEGADPTLCSVASGTDLACAVDGGFEVRLRGTGRLTAPAGWPHGAATRLVVADDAGAWWSDDAGLTWNMAALPAEDPPGELKIASDDSLWLTTRSGVLLRSLDGGESWEDTGVRFTSMPQALTPRPGFPDHPELLVGTADGVWVVEDPEGDAWIERWGGWQRVQVNGSSFSQCEGCAPTELFDAFRGAGGQRLDPGATLRTTLRGDRIAVTGLCDRASEAVLRVDGVQITRFGDRVDVSAHTLATAQGLADTWHEVEIAGVRGDGVVVSGIEARGDGVVLAYTPGARFGCGGSGDAAVLAGASLLARRRRPRRR
jgi:hypothetical protein